MKKHLLRVSVVLLGLSINTVKAQLISTAADDFEVWSHTAVGSFFPTAYDDPNTGLGSSGWQTFNVLSSSLAGQSDVSVFKDSTTVHTGKYSCEIKSVALTSGSYSYVKGFIPHDTAGIVVCGTTVLSPTSFKTGLKYSSRIGNMAFWYQYAPQTSKLGEPDTAFCTISISHFSGGKRNILGGAIATLTAASNWILVNVPVQYDSSTGNPDTVTVLFSASSFTHPALGSILHIDGESIVAGVNELHAASASVNVYPDPASTEINLSVSSTDMANYANIYDITGKKLSSFEVRNNFATVNTSAFAPGLYIYQLYDKSGSLMKTGKFSVAK